MLVVLCLVVYLCGHQCSGKPGYRVPSYNEAGYMATGYMEAGYREAGRWEAGYRTETSYKETGFREASHREASHREPGHKEPGHRNAGNRDTGHGEGRTAVHTVIPVGKPGYRVTGYNEAGYMPTNYREAGFRENVRWESGYREVDRWEAGYMREKGYREASFGEAGYREANYREASHREPGHREPGHKEPGQRNAGNRDAGHGEERKAVHTVIPVGALFDHKADAAARSGYLYAISVYNDTSKDALSFATVYDEVDISNNFKVASKICSQMAGGIFALYGKTDTKSFSIIQSFSNAFHMPFVTFSLCGSAEQKEKPYIVFIKPSYTDAITDIIKTFKWTQMDYLYDSDEGLMRVQYIYNKLKETEGKIDMGFRRLEDVNNAHGDLRRLDRIKKPGTPKNVILDLSSQEAYRTILKQIPEVGMNREGYNYLMGTLDMMSLNLTRFRHGGVNITGFQLVNHTSPAVRKFLIKWSDLESSVWPGGGTPVLDVDAALSVDGVDTISKALKLMIKKDDKVFKYTFRRSQVFNCNKTKGIPCLNPAIPWMHGEDIYNSIKQVNFTGLTGNLAFDEKGFRKDYKLDILTVSLNNGPEKVGEWDSNTGLKSVYDEVKNKSIKWNYTQIDYERTVVSIVAPPFLYIINKSDNGRPPMGNDRYEGYCKDLADAIAQELGISYKLVLVADNKYGIEMENGSWNGIIGELRSGTAQLAVAPLTITAERERVVDFSKPFMNVGISIMIIKPEKQKPGVFSYMEPFTINIWACITIAYIVVSVGIYMASRFSPYEWSTEDLTSGHIYHNQFTLPNSFWFSMGALMLQGSDHVCPRSTAGRIIGGAWWFFVLITISSYTANLAAFLTIERMLTPIASADALAKQTEIAYGTVDSGSTKTFFKKSKVITYKNMWNYMSTASPPVFTKSIQEGFERVKNSKGKYAFLMESSANDFYNNRKPCNTMRVGANLDLKGFGIATPLNSDLKEAINYMVLKLKEDGTLHKLQQTWWYEKGECGTNPGHRESKKRSLSLSNVAGIFYILICGLVVAIITGLLEIYYGKRNPPKLVHYSYSRRWQNSRPNLGVTSKEHHNGLFVDTMIR